MVLLGQERARFALERIKSGDIGQNGESFKRALRKLPGNLHTMGLGQTVAVLLGGEKAEKTVCEWIEQWLRVQTIYPANQSLINCITGSRTEMPDDEIERLYREASIETRELAVWLKRFAEAFL